MLRLTMVLAMPGLGLRPVEILMSCSCCVRVQPTSAKTQSGTPFSE